MWPIDIAPLSFVKQGTVPPVGSGLGAPLLCLFAGEQIPLCNRELAPEFLLVFGQDVL
jgi:hypothetical protein